MAIGGAVGPGTAGSMLRADRLVSPHAARVDHYGEPVSVPKELPAAVLDAEPLRSDFGGPADEHPNAIDATTTIPVTMTWLM
jgi:hypothetical protein